MVVLAPACSSTTASTGGAAPAPETNKPGAAVPSGKGGGLVYRPIPSAAYKMERHDSLTLQFPGGAEQQQARERVAFVHVLVGGTSGAATFPVTIVLDSLEAFENGAPVDSAAFARGSHWTGTLGPDGTLSQLQADRTGTLADELSGRLRLFFPRLPAGGAHAGQTWTDSSEYKLVADAFPSTEKQVTTYTASETPGTKGLTLESSGTYARSGTRQQADQVLDMTGTGERHGVHQIGPNGAIVSASGNDSGDMSITVPAVGQTVPVKQSGSYSITPITSR